MPGRAYLTLAEITEMPHQLIEEFARVSRSSRSGDFWNPPLFALKWDTTQISCRKLPL